MTGILGLLIPILALSIPIVAIWTSHQRKLAEIQIKRSAGNASEVTAQYAAQVRELEERVRVLERIITDRGYDVASQIEALRDTQRVEELLKDREPALAKRDGEAN